MSEKKLRPIKLNRYTMMGEDNSSSRNALVKVKLEKDKHVSSGSSGKAIVTVKLEKEEEEEEGFHHVTRSVLKRKQLSQSVDNNSLVAVKSENYTFEKQRTTRWSTNR